MDASELEVAGLIDSKFGTVTLLRHPGDADMRACLGFIRHLDDPHLQISGWSCQGDALPARRDRLCSEPVDAADGRK
jgi:hypothetical protein